VASPVLKIQDVVAGEGYPPVIVAELGINHGGSLSVAKLMARRAVESGIRLIKHQTHIPKLEMSREAQLAIPGNASESIFEVISKNSLSLEQESELADYVRDLGAVYFSTPFSREAADFLDQIKVPLFKIGSGECNNYPFVEHVAKKGKPVVLSTGMNSIESITPAVEILRSQGVPFALLHTTNLYPTPTKLVRANAMVELRDHFPDAVVGLSDHSQSNSASFAAVSLGASIIERHFTDSKNRTGPDIICSMSPEEARSLVEISCEISAALGSGKAPLEEEQVTINFAFSSVATLRDVQAGEVFSKDNIFPIRPSGGDFGPSDYESLLGQRASRFIQSRVQLKREDIQR
jgi:N-acetylneuraminate synthase